MMELSEQSHNNQVSSKSLELFWREHIQLKKESGLSGAAYCRQHQLICHQLYYWESKLRLPVESESPDFIAVKLDSRSVPFVSVAPIVLCSLELKNGQQLKIHDAAVLPLLISLLS